MSNLKTSFNTFNGYAPKEGVKALPLDFDFTSVGRIQLDLLNENTQGVIQFVQSVWVDNSDNPNALVITFGVTGQRITVPANAHGMWPVIAIDQVQFTLESVVDPDATGQIILMNVPMAYTQGGPTVVTVNFPPGTIVDTQPYQADPANTFNASVDDAGTPIFAANAARRALTFSALGSNIDPIEISVGGFPIATLLPGENWSSGNWVPMGAIVGTSINAGTTPDLQAIEFE